MKIFRQYIRVFLAITRNSLSYAMIYRADFLANIASGLCWALQALLIGQVLYLRTPAINGWAKGELYLVFLVFTFVYYMSGIVTNYIALLERDIRKGYFDRLLIKPIDAQFLTIFGQPDFTGFTHIIFYSIPLIVATTKVGVNIHWTHMPVFLLLIFSAFCIWTSLRMIVMTFNFWHQRLDNAAVLLSYTAEFAKYPTSVYPRAMQYFFYTVLPVGFLAIVPAQALLGAISWSAVFASCGATVITMVTARLLWNKAIKSYSSASS